MVQYSDGQRRSQEPLPPEHYRSLACWRGRHVTQASGTDETGARRLYPTAGHTPAPHCVSRFPYMTTYGDREMP
jgi:hypothetical protein